jgi:hypothetical protein
MPRESYILGSATVAHEGNPRTNSLAITGTLDGEAWLIPTFLPGSAVSGTDETAIVRDFPPAPGGIELIRIEQSCGDMFVWTKDYGHETSPFNLSSFTNSGQNWSEYDPTFKLTVRSVVAGCCGILRHLPRRPITSNNLSGDPSSDLRFITRVDSVSGTPQVGICIWMDESLTSVNSVSCFALIPNYTTEITTLYKFSSDSICNILNGEVLATIASVPQAGGGLDLQVQNNPIPTASVQGEVWTDLSTGTGTATGGITDDYAIYDDDTPIAKASFGYISIPGSSGSIVFTGGTGTVNGFGLPENILVNSDNLG